MKIEQAAEVLGAKSSEVVEVVDTDDGVVITMVSGTQHIVVPEDRPDYEGKTGLMLFRKPNPDAVYAAPVFAADPDVEAPVVDDEDDDEPAAQPAKRPAKKAAKKAAAPVVDDEDDDDA